MTPKKLRLKGFKGIRSGFGRDDISLDFDAIVGEQIAIVAPNGKGKSTILDNMQPYRIMPSRVSSYSPKSFSYWDVIYGPEAIKEFEWEHQGKRYQQTLVFRDSGKTRKVEAYLHAMADGMWQPAILADGTVSDGKTDTYDRCIEGILGNPETFFTSVFSAQQRRPLSAYTDGEIKTLLADLLQLTSLRTTGEQASQVVKLLMAGLDAMRSALTGIASKENQLPILSASSAAKERDLESLMADRSGAAVALSKAQMSLASVKTAKASAAETDARRSALNARLNTFRKTNAESQQQLRADIEREETRSRQADAEHKRLATDAEQRMSALGDLIAKKRELIARKPAIESACSKSAALAESEKYTAAELDGLRANLAKANSLQAERATLAGGLQGVAREGSVQAAACEGLERRAALAGQVPCKGSDLQPKCPLLRDAIEAKAGLSGHRQKVITLRAQYRSHAEKINALDAQIKEFGDLPALIARKEAELNGIKLQVLDASKLQALVPQLVDAEDGIRTFEEQIQVLRSDMKNRQEATRTLGEQSAMLIVDLRARLGALAEDLSKTEASIDADVVALPPAFDDAQLSAAELGVKDAEKRITSFDLKVEQIRSEWANTKASIAALEADIVSGAVFKQKATRIENEIAKWIVLAKAFSNNGIIALSIDDAGPALAGIVNDLLLACHGRRFTVSIQTQTSNAKGEIRESFDILVYDAERNETKSVTDMSGGEKVWINEALTRGIALYLARESGLRYETLFSDEADGPLDPERKLQFMRMKREALRIGGYQREYFVSQTPELWEMADARIELSML